MYDEYSKVYDQSGVATICTYSSRRITSYKQLPYSACRDIPASKDDGDHMFVKCGSCGEYMDFTNDYFTCPSCGARVRQMTPYSRVSRDVFKRANDWELEYGEPYPW